MKPANVNLEIYKGSTYTKEIQWLSGDPAVPVNLTNCTARMQIRKTIYEGVSDELTTANQRIEIFAPLEGRLRLKFPPSITSNYNFTTALYDLEIVFGTETQVTRIMQGTITTVAEITR
jgi:hypothetical protein